MWRGGTKGKSFDFVANLSSCATDLSSRTSCEEDLRVMVGRKHWLEADRFRAAFEYAPRGLDFYSFEPHLTLTIRFYWIHKNAPQVTH